MTTTEGKCQVSGLDEFYEALDRIKMDFGTQDQEPDEQECDIAAVLAKTRKLGP